MRHLTRFRPRAFELLALGAFTATAVALRLADLRVGPSTLLLSFRTTGPTLLAALAVGVVLNLLYRLREKGGAWAYLRRIRTAEWFLDTARIWLSCVLLAHAYTWLKVFVPLVNGRRWDVELAWFDQALHLGLSPNRFLVALFEGTPVLAFIDWTYFLWLPFALAFFGFFAAFPDRRTRAQFVFSHVAIWTLGVWIYVAVPALGPALAFPDEWKLIRASIPMNSGGQVTLLLNYQLVLDAKLSGEVPPYLKPGLGVAAMPSLHVGIDWLLLLWCRRRAPRLALPLLLAFLVHYLGSIVTGWHYAVDAYVGMVIAALAVWAAGRTARDLPGEGPEGEAGLHAAAPPPGESAA